jgi:antitoxin ChpS
MHTTNLRKVGGSAMLTVPPAFLEILQFRSGATVALAVEGGPA